MVKRSCAGCVSGEKDDLDTNQDYMRLYITAFGLANTNMDINVSIGYGYDRTHTLFLLTKRVRINKRTILSHLNAKDQVGYFITILRIVIGFDLP